MADFRVPTVPRKRICKIFIIAVMKLHIALKAAILSKAPQIPPVYHESLLVYYASPYIYVAEIETGRILHKLRYEDVQVLKVCGGRLCVATNVLYIIDMQKYEIIEVIRVGKALINNLEYDSIGGTFILSQINGSVSICNSTAVIRRVDGAGYCDIVFKNGATFGYVDKERIVIYRGDQKLCDEPMCDIVEAYVVNDEVYSVEEDGTLRGWLNGSEMRLGVAAEHAKYIEGVLYISAGTNIYSYSARGELISTVDMLKAVHEYSGTIEDMEEAGSERIPIEDGNSQDKDSVKKLKINDINQNIDSIDTDELNEESYSSEIEDDHIEDGDEEEDDASESSAEFDEVPSGQDAGSDDGGMVDSEPLLPVISYFDKNLIVISDKNVIVHKEFAIQKIFSFNDDITDTVQFGGFLIAATTSGQLIYMDPAAYVTGEYVCSCRCFFVHSDAISSAAISEDLLLTGSKDGTAFLWALSTSADGLLHLKRIRVFNTALSPVSAVGCAFGMIVIASYNNVLQVYKIKIEKDINDDNMQDDMKVSSISFDNILVQKAHTKAINHIAITPAYVITCSSDKTAKIFNHDGVICQTITSDKLLHCSFDEKHIALCSHKAIKVLDAHTLSQVSSFQVKRPVTTSCFHAGSIIAVSDVVRVYDIKKNRCVKSYDFEVTNAWSFTFPVIAGDNKIVFLQDESIAVNAQLAEELRTEKEDNLLLDIYCRHNRFRDALGVAIRRSDYKKMYRIVCQGFYAEKNLEFLDIFNGCVSKLSTMLLKNAGIKHSEVFHRVLLQTSCPLQKEKLQDICKKHYGAIDRVFLELLALDVFSD